MNRRMIPFPFISFSYKGLLSTGKDDRKLSIMLSHMFDTIFCGVCMPHFILIIIDNY